MIKNSMLMLLISFVGVWAIHMNEGDLWRITLEITEGEVTFDKELYALVGSGNTLLIPGMVGEYEEADSGIVLKKYGAHASLVDGKKDRTVSSQRMNLFTTRVFNAADSTTSWVTSFEKVPQKSQSALKDFRGVLLGGGNRRDMVLFVADTVYQYENEVCRKLVVKDMKDRKIELHYENGDTIDECIDLDKSEGFFAELTDLETLLDSLIPLHESETIASLGKLANINWDSTTFSEHDYAKVLQNYIYNNYGFLKPEAMRTLHFLLDVRFESVTHELLFLLEEYCQKQGYNVENVAEKVEKRLQKEGITLLKDDQDNVSKGLFLLYLEDSCKPRSREQRKVFTLLKDFIVHYTRDDA